MIISGKYDQDKWQTPKAPPVALQAGLLIDSYHLESSIADGHVLNLC